MTPFFYAESYLPSPKGLEIICNPEPGATDPSSIRTLVGMGARMKFSDRLHAKVYWSEKGCIITSANISYRALGQSNQKEAGVLIDSNEFDIDRFVAHSEPYDVTQEVMDRLEVLLIEKLGALLGRNQLENKIRGTLIGILLCIESRGKWDGGRIRS